MRNILMRNSNLQNFEIAVENLDFSDVLDCWDVKLGIALFDDIITKYFKLNCPIKNRNVLYKSILKPWIDEFTKGEIRRRENYLKLYRAGVMSRDVFVGFRNYVTGLIRRSYYVGNFNSVRGDIRRTWSLINGIKRPNSRSNKGIIPKIKVGDNLIENSSDIANAMNEIFLPLGLALPAPPIILT